MVVFRGFRGASGNIKVVSETSGRFRRFQCVTEGFEKVSEGKDAI